MTTRRITDSSIGAGGGGAVVRFQDDEPIAIRPGELWVESDGVSSLINANDYLTKADANVEYLSNASASATYLTQTSASTLYATQTSVTNSLALKANLTVDLTSTSASAYTLQLADAGKLLTVDTSSGSVSVQIPTNDSQAFPTGTVIALNWVGAATAVTITAASGVTLNSTIGSGSPVPLSGRYAGAQIYKIATNTWIAVGSLA